MPCSSSNRIRVGHYILYGVHNYTGTRSLLVCVLRILVALYPVHLGVLKISVLLIKFPRSGPVLRRTVLYLLIYDSAPLNYSYDIIPITRNSRTNEYRY